MRLMRVGFRSVVPPSFLAFVLALAMLGQPSLAGAQGPPDQKPDPAKKYGPEANPGQVFKETKGKSAKKSKGMEVRELRGRAAGKPISSMPGAKAIGRDGLKAMKEIPKTGLFLVDLDHVPPGLEEDLEKNGYRLSEDGTLTQEGNPVALFVHGETFQFKPDKAAGAPGGDRGGNAPSDSASSAFWKLIDSGLSLVSTEAEAAAPFPWRCGTWYWKWQYNGGFCRDYKVWTDAYAWGPGADGVCANPKPLTRIEYISTYARVSTKSDWDYHYNADQSHSYAKWDIGCFWPAHGGGSGYHYAYWRDGSAWMYRTYSW